jgi:hypothetical protein
MQNIHDEIRVLEMEIRVNEMLPRSLRCTGFIARQKKLLAALKRKSAGKPDLKLVPQNN